MQAKTHAKRRRYGVEVLYLVDTDDFTDWNPVFLYFAKRDGYNVTRERFVRHPEVLARIGGTTSLV